MKVSIPQQHVINKMARGFKLSRSQGRMTCVVLHNDFESEIIPIGVFRGLINHRLIKQTSCDYPIHEYQLTDLGYDSANPQQGANRCKA